MLAAIAVRSTDGRRAPTAAAVWSIAPLIFVSQTQAPASPVPLPCGKMSTQSPSAPIRATLPRMTRDFVGYGPTPPDPRWPGGARIAVNFVLNHEEGSEPSYPDGDNVSEWGLTEVAPVNPGVVGRDLAAESMFAYGSRVGVWRILRLFAERALPLTVFGCALALERNPQVAAAIRAAGHDVCCHGWRWVKHYELSEADERAQIAKAVASIAATMGERPQG